MEELGYNAKPSCMDYRVARSLELHAVPEGFKWAGKKQQDRKLLERLVKKYERSTQSQRSEENSSAAEEVNDELVNDDDAGSTGDKSSEILSLLVDIKKNLKQVVEELKLRRELQACAREEVVARTKRKREATIGASEPEFIEGSSKRGCCVYWPCSRYSFRH